MIGSATPRMPETNPAGPAPQRGHAIAYSPGPSLFDAEASLQARDPTTNQAPLEQTAPKSMNELAPSRDHSPSAPICISIGGSAANFRDLEMQSAIQNCNRQRGRLSVVVECFVFECGAAVRTTTVVKTVVKIDSRWLKPSGESANCLVKRVEAIGTYSYKASAKSLVYCRISRLLGQSG